MDMANSAQHMPAEQMAELGVNSMMVNVVSGMMAINWPFIILVVYHVTFWVVILCTLAFLQQLGQRVDAETDTQQFMLPITLPLVFSIALIHECGIARPERCLKFLAKYYSPN